MKVNYKRLLWIVFILLYSGVFFYNCLHPYENWFFSYLYTMLLILWLCTEYYLKHLFFQPTFMPNESHSYLFRGLFALFFYSAFVFGITTIVWWHQYRIISIPVLPIAGILLLGYSVYMRWQCLIKLKNGKQAIRQFFFSIALLIFSMVLGYDSYFLLVYATVIGLPLIVLQTMHYHRQETKVS